MTKLPTVKAKKLKALIYLENTNTADGKKAVRKVYKIKRLAETNATPVNK